MELLGIKDMHAKGHTNCWVSLTWIHQGNQFET